MENMDTVDNATAGLVARNGHTETVGVKGFYTVECVGPDGVVKWTDTIENLVTNVGKADMLDRYFEGSSYTAAFYIGLVDNASFTAYNAADTMSSHGGWIEGVPYSNATRPAAVFGTAAGSGGGAGTAGTGTLATGATAFTINATLTVLGCFLTTVSTKSGTTGTLFSAGSFSGGSRAVVSADTLNVTYTVTN